MDTATTWAAAFLLVLAVTAGLVRSSLRPSTWRPWSRRLGGTGSRQASAHLSSPQSRPAGHPLPPAVQIQAPHARLLRVQVVRRLRHHPAQWSPRPPVRMLARLDPLDRVASAPAMPQPAMAPASGWDRTLREDQALLAACGADRIDLVHLGPDERGLHRDPG